MGKKRISKKGEGSTEEGSQKSDRGTSSAARHVTRGIVYVQATYNNTTISITDEKGAVLAWSSAGALGFSGAKKATPFAAARIAETVAGKIRRTGIQELAIRVKGVGSGRDSAIRALANQGFAIISIKDVTPIPHNGPRPRKVRRV